MNQGEVFIKRNSLFCTATVAEMKTLLQQNRNLSKETMFYGTPLRGTKQYWYTKCGELLDMCRQLKCLTAFVTHSAADLHWPNLFRLLDEESRLARVTELKSARYRQKLVNDNALTNAEFFHRRAEYFVKTTMNNK